MADPKDDVFISCAVEGRARYIISGNHHLQELRRYGRIRIRTVARFLRTLERLERWRSGQLRSTVKGMAMTGLLSM
jgi:predicted nucleic acid-binding protein